MVFPCLHAIKWFNQGANSVYRMLQEPLHLSMILSYLWNQIRYCNIQLSALRPMQSLPSRGYFFVFMHFSVQFPQPSLSELLLEKGTKWALQYFPCHYAGPSRRNVLIATLKNLIILWHFHSHPRLTCLTQKLVPCLYSCLEKGQNGWTCDEPLLFLK